MTEFSLVWWVGFTLFIVGLMALDLGVFHRRDHAVGLGEALTWSAVWIILALIFNGWLYYKAGTLVATEFFTGYLVEKSLSIDNVFVFAMIFTYFAVPAAYQHKVLFWGICSALVMRCIMIWIGSALLQNFSWIIYLFGAFLIITGIKMLVYQGHSIDLTNNPAIKLLKRFIPVGDTYSGSSFFRRENGRLIATPLLVVLVTVEFSDLIFAVDSIPAIFAITDDPFIVYTSNVFAMLGLRSLYFAIAGIMGIFHYLKYGLGLILVFVGIKMILAHTIYKIDTMLAMGIICSILILSVLASLLWPNRNKNAQ